MHLRVAPPQSCPGVSYSGGGDSETPSAWHGRPDSVGALRLGLVQQVDRFERSRTMTSYQLILSDRLDNGTKFVVDYCWVEADTRDDAISQRPDGWPVSRTSATSRGPFA